jgi:type I restriction enzyme M protein
MFYNTGIATYIWVLTNRKPAHRRGKVQLIDATPRSGSDPTQEPRQEELRAGRGGHPEDLRHLPCLQGNEQSKVFPNAAFGYWKVTVERPLRLKGIEPDRAYTPKAIKALKETAERAEDAPPVIKKIHKRGAEPDPLHGLFANPIVGADPRGCSIVEYEPDTDLRDTPSHPSPNNPPLSASSTTRTGASGATSAPSRS